MTDYSAPQPTAGSNEDPGKTLGIVGLVLAFVFALAGIIVSAIAWSKSKQAGHKNTLATVGLVLSIIFFIGQIIAIIAIVAGGVFLADNADQILCEGQGPGVYELSNGETITCD